MELMEGRELQEIINSRMRLLITDALNIAIQVSAGLFYAHQCGIVHGDIKPSNIMILGGNLVKIADFGIARMVTHTAITQDSELYGTPPFMSPEQIQGKPIDGRSDIFSLWVVLYYMLTDRLPFPEEDMSLLKNQISNFSPEKPSSINPGIPETLDTVIYKCLAKSPDDRFKNANDLANDLRSCLSALTHNSAGTTHPFTSNPKFKRLKRLVAPRRFSRNLVANGSYISMVALIVISIINFVTPASIQLNLLYIFPLIMISLHCERIKLISGAVVLALLLQGFNLVNDAIPISSKITLAVIILLSNIAIVFLASNRAGKLYRG